eukprot:CAMPEP_0170557014 /NCGR_PEP_ID=MMETSP0211-20121228/19136_1 /TAXON_ID=311385 /ORGANISM="Pseudokeronopsis sp., Strain OXSARD2" /LENGTH=132 /DNA_ID=CAMNT_0010867697 /DNA_START=3 /DNA_END=401 /DNA_ORIENTATION=-
MNKEEQEKEYEAVLELIYSQLGTILDKRPKNPVTKFAKKILEAVDLNSEGEELTEKDKAKRLELKEKKAKQKRKQRGEEDKEGGQEGEKKERRKKKRDPNESKERQLEVSPSIKKEQKEPEKEQVQEPVQEQ